MSDKQEARGAQEPQEAREAPGGWGGANGHAMVCNAPIVHSAKL